MLPSPLRSTYRAQSTGKPRVICLTAKRRSKKRGFKGTLHVCKLAQGRYQARRLPCFAPLQSRCIRLEWQCVLHGVGIRKLLGCPRYLLCR